MFGVSKRGRKRQLSNKWAETESSLKCMDSYLANVVKVPSLPRPRYHHLCSHPWFKPTKKTTINNHTIVTITTPEIKKNNQISCFIESVMNILIG